jgi:predicted nucleic acid-binding protein
VNPLASVLLSPEEAQAMKAPGATNAAVLVPTFNDPKDRHVLAAAVRGNAEVLVTSTVKT